MTDPNSPDDVTRKNEVDGPPGYGHSKKWSPGTKIVVAIGVLLFLILLVSSIFTSLEYRGDTRLPALEVHKGAVPDMKMKVPGVDVTMKEKTVKVPHVEVRKPAATPAESPKQK